MPLLDFPQTRSLLAKYGLPLAKTAYARDAATLAKHVDSLKPPFVLKAVGPTIKHKTERGLVVVGIHTHHELERSVAHMTNLLEPSERRSSGFIVQETLRGAELIIGAKRDPSFGPVVLFGTGGIYAELLDDVAVRTAPLSIDDCREMVAETKASKFLAGFRGMKADANEIYSLLMKTSKLIDQEKHVVELDFNPVIATGNGAFIADARVVVE